MLQARRHATRKIEPPIDLIGNDPQASLAREFQDRLEIILARRPPARIGRRVDHDHPRLWPHRSKQLIQIQLPAVAAQRHLHRFDFGARRLDSAAEIRPGRRRHHHFVASPHRHLKRQLDRLHPATGDKEILRRKNPPIVPRVIRRNRLAQRRQTPLIRVERLTAEQRLAGRIRNERRRRQITLARPHRNQTRLVPATVEHFDNAALRQGSRRWPERCFQLVCGRVHAHQRNSLCRKPYPHPPRETTGLETSRRLPPSNSITWNAAHPTGAPRPHSPPSAVGTASTPADHARE